MNYWKNYLKTTLKNPFVSSTAGIGFLLEVEAALAALLKQLLGQTVWQT